MASSNHPTFLVFPLLNTAFISTLSSNGFVKSRVMYHFSCTKSTQTCNAYLYHNSKGYSVEQIASFYSVNASNVKPFSHDSKQDYLVSVPCSCKDVNGIRGYFYDTSYKVRAGDTFFDISDEFYSGQAWEVGGEEELFAGDTVPIHLICGCIEVKSQEIETYTVEDHDTLSRIAELISAEVTGIEKLNERLTKNPSFLDVGWVLFLPREKSGIQTPQER